MNISGILAIGNGEKCPYCEIIIEDNTDTLKHLMDSHPKELEQTLFKGE
tara:strand:+ start:1355 stop:1501 length:147 start_codon:yes stop_codon:yes gene_type:complete